MMRLQQFYINIINLILLVTLKIEKKKREAIAFCCFFMIYVIYLICNIPGVEMRGILIQGMGSILLGLGTLLMLEQEIHCVQWKRSLYIPWGIMCLGILVSAFLVEINYLLHGVVFIFVLPAVLLILSNIKNRKWFFILILKAMMVSFVLFMLASLLFSPVSIAQYAGIFNNPNGMGQYLIVLCAAALFLYGECKCKMIYSVLIGCVICFAILSRSRTTLLSLFVILLIWGCYLLAKKTSVGDCVKLFTIIILCVFCTYFLFSNAQKVTDVLPRIDYTQQLDLYYDKEATAGELLLSRITVENKDLDTYSSGRIAIWKAYIEKLNFSGHGLDDKFEIYPGMENSTAHNSVIQIAYQSGYIAGCMYLIYICVSCLYSFFYWIKSRCKDLEQLFGLMISVGYFIVNMLSSAYTPFVYLLALMYYLAQITILEKNCS